MPVPRQDGKHSWWVASQYHVGRTSKCLLMLGFSMLVRSSTLLCSIYSWVSLVRTAEWRSSGTFNFQLLYLALVNYILTVHNNTNSNCSHLWSSSSSQLVIRRTPPSAIVRFWWLEAAFVTVCHLMSPQFQCWLFFGTAQKLNFSPDHFLTVFSF